VSHMHGSGFRAFAGTVDDCGVCSMWKFVCMNANRAQTASPLCLKKNDRPTAFALVSKQYSDDTATKKRSFFLVGAR
jgi:hypothetical protein